jgi:hypothetical protein
MSQDGRRIARIRGQSSEGWAEVREVESGAGDSDGRLHRFCVRP